MSKSEIKGLHFWKGHQTGSTHCVPCGLNIKEKLWWYLMPGVTFKVKWPVGDVLVEEGDKLWDWTIGPRQYYVTSANPNDHYRPYLEEHIGKQKWDWDWGQAGNDITNNCLTIKIRQKHAHHAIMLALRWS